MSNQICRQRPRAVAVNYMARLSSAPARPCTVRKTAEIKSTHRPQISLIPIDMCTWHRLPCRWLPPTHRTHAAAPSREDRCRVVWRASTHRLEMPIYILQQQSRAAGPSGLYHHPRVRPRRAFSSSSEGSRHRSSYGSFHLTLEISARTCMCEM